MDLDTKTNKFKKPTFEQLSQKFASSIFDFAYNKLMEGLELQCTVKKLHSTSKTFQSFPYALYATKVTFEQFNRPSGPIEEINVHVCGKHKLYAPKVDFSVFSNACVLFSRKSPGLVSDLTIMSNHLHLHERYLQKSSFDSAISDYGKHVQKHFESWAMLWDKCCVEAFELMCVIHPQWKSPNESFFVTDEACKDLVASDLVIVKNYFGKLRSIWFFLSLKSCWNPNAYDMFFVLAMGFNNLHFLRHPLRASDGESFVQLQNRMYSTVFSIAEKRRRIQARYRAKCVRPLQSQFFNSGAWTESE